MKVHKYTAKTSRDALRQVREDLGPDAVILANRMVRGGVEILAMAALDHVPAQQSDAPIDAREPALSENAASALPHFAAQTASSGTAGLHVVRGIGRRVDVAGGTPFDPLDVGDEDVVYPLTPAQFAAVRAPIATPARPQTTAHVAPVAATLQRRPLNLGPEPAILRRRSEPAAPAFGASNARSEAAPDDSSTHAVALAGLAQANDPLMAALADEVRSLGGMLGQHSTTSVSSLHATEAARPPAARGQAENEDWVRNVMGELRSMRMLIQDQIGAVPLTDGGRAAPGKMRAARVLSAAGFSAPLIRKVTARLPDGISEVDALAFVRRAIAANLQVTASEAELLDAGGVVAIVGPTGAGKTTTVAKLAARFVVRHGAENLALLTTDGYRIGGQEQLRIYGKILGVAVYAVKDAEDLKRTLSELRGRKLVLIDTVGLSQRDRMVNEQLALFANCGVAVKRLLLLNATCHGETLSDVVRAYKGDGLAGCILSKLDEALTLGSALDAAIRQRLRVFYAADGQRVPEDLHLANASALVERALQAAPEHAAYGALDLDFPFDVPIAAPPFAHPAAAAAGGMAHG